MAPNTAFDCIISIPSEHGDVQDQIGSKVVCRFVGKTSAHAVGPSENLNREKKCWTDLPE